MLLLFAIANCFLYYGRFSNEDPAKSGLGSKRILNVEGVLFSARYKYLVHHNLDSKDPGFWDLGMKHDRIFFWLVESCDR